MKLSDNPNELLVQVSLANQQAFKKLYQLTSAKLFAISVRITQQEKLSEEVLQDSFLKIWNNANRFDPEKAQAITWMGTIVRNQSIDMIRKNKKHEHDELLDEQQTQTVDETDTPEHLAITQNQLQHVHICMKELEQQHQDVILMAYLDGYTHQQIAEQQSVPVGSVKTWIHRGVKQIKQCIQRMATA